MVTAAPCKSIVQPQSHVELWKGSCSFGCYHAMGKRKKCKCRCRGKLHGKAHDNQNEKLRIVEIEESLESQ